MPTTLKIIWDGDAPGLAEHRLSLSAFGEPLLLLLAAYKRIASNALNDALGEGETPATGRLANPARQLDIEIVSLEKGSAGIAAVCTFQPLPASIGHVLDILPDIAGYELLEAIAQESRGQLRNHSVRKYLRSLPSGVRRQEYVLTDQLQSERRVELGEVRLPESPREMPYLMQFIGSIVGVGFEPGKPDIRLKTDTTQIVLTATPEQVNQAIELRNVTVRVMAVKTQPARLLRLEAADAPEFQATPDYIEEYIFKRWHELLERLAH